MATGDQLKSLVKAYINCDDSQFKTVVLQIAAHEARSGHHALALDLKKQVDNLGSKRRDLLQVTSTNPMLSVSIVKHSLSELVASEDIIERIKRILIEYRYRNRLAAHRLSNRKRILLEGKPGTGKTLTASIIASELTLPLFIVQTDKLVTKFMGETSVKLRQVFDFIGANTGVYLFDEFDAIGADRSLDNEVGEMRRILNSFLKFVEEDYPESIIVAATNNPKLLDQALFRRFDDVLHYDLPSHQEIKQLLIKGIQYYDIKFSPSEELIAAADGLCHAEIVRACDDAVKNSIINDEPIKEDELLVQLKDRHNVYLCKGA